MNDPLLNRILYQLPTVVKIKLVHYLGAVILDCLDTEMQQIRDLTIGIALSDQLQNFALARGEDILDAYTLPRLQALYIVFDDHLCNRRV